MTPTNVPLVFGEPERPEQVDEAGMHAALDALYDGDAWTPLRDSYVRQMAEVGWTSSILMAMAQGYVRRTYQAAHPQR